MADNLDLPDLPSVQWHLLFVIAGATGKKTHGLDLKDRFEEDTGLTVNHGKLYQNLGELVDYGYVVKSPIGRRENSYQLSNEGLRLVRRYNQWTNEMIERTSSPKK